MKASPRIHGRDSTLEARDDVIVPAVCFSTCNNAYLEAQTVGKTPALCGPESTFIEYYKSCSDCISANTSPDLALEAQKAYLEPKFAQFINFCFEWSAPASTTGTGIRFTSVATDFDTASLESKWSSIGRAASSEGYIVLPTNLVIITTETTSAPTTLPDGRVTSAPVTRVATIPNLSAWKFTVPVSSTTTTTGPPSSPSLPPSGEATSATLAVDQPEANKAWIAGPVIGGIAAVAILGFAGFFLFFIRPRRRAAANGGEKDMTEKAQLHADSIPKPPPQEMEGEVNTYPELPANEVPAAELPAGEIGHDPPRDVSRHEM
ncbi:hypothetical protein B0T18DRAFT_210161 [Schizothecium vesticola]|uniref:Uncharacterized protein n=1 Tax=Schizothecium vesticola TaxID=314040 RepID=A0AA40JZ09_9PEZI|nr:hypothetical protein B0T18DRAFT_210161 [Schizothecium vesticola]